LFSFRYGFLVTNVMKNTENYKYTRKFSFIEEEEERFYSSKYE
jgi:hypothetical protein